MYIDAKKTLADGRKLPAKQCVEYPTMQELKETIEHLGYDAAYEEKAMLQQSNSNPCPHDRYSAYVLEPQTVEFYSGGHAGYVNDRFLYVRAPGGAWDRMRLQG